MLLFIFLVFFNQSVFANTASENLDVVKVESDKVTDLKDPEVSPKLSESQCEALAVTKDLQAKYDSLKKSIESDFSTGLPNQLKTRLNKLRSEADSINQKIYDLQNNNQEINSIVANTINKLDEFIQLLPSISDYAPKIRDQYIVPFANLNSLKAEEQQCLVEMQLQASKEETAINIYQKLTQELQAMSSNLYEAERTSAQKYIIYRSELIETLSRYNKKNRLEDAQTLLATIPKAINAIQGEIESLLPGLQLSKNYSSITSI